MKFVKTVFVNDSYLDYIGSEQLYLIGLLAADGNVNKTGRISIAQSKDCGLSLITYIKSILQYSGKILETQTLSGNISYTLSFDSNNILQVLNRFNITPNKSLIYKYPASEIPQNLLASFLRGYFDGDGCIGTYSVGHSTQYLKMSIYGTYDFITSISEICPIKGIIHNRKTGAELIWNGKKAELFGEWLFSDASLFNSIKVCKFKEYQTISKKYNQYDTKCKQASELYQNGISVADISEQLSVPFQTIYKWRKRWNWKSSNICEVEKP